MLFLRGFWEPVCTPGSGIWNEGDDGEGDAGPTLASANNTIGTNPLTEICGKLPDANVDMYAIMITGSPFTAVATGAAVNGLSEPTLYLFDSAGHGLDAAFNNSGTASLTVTGLTAGLYYLALASENRDPQNASHQLIFGTSTTPVVSDTVLKSWTGTGDSSGNYVITLRDAGFANLPEPGTFALIGVSLGLVGLVRKRAR